MLAYRKQPARKQPRSVLGKVARNQTSVSICSLSTGEQASRRRELKGCMCALAVIAARCWVGLSWKVLALLRQCTHYHHAYVLACVHCTRKFYRQGTLDMYPACGTRSPKDCAWLVPLPRITIQYVHPANALHSVEHDRAVCIYVCDICSSADPNRMLLS